METSPATVSALSRKYRNSVLALEWFNALAAAYFFNYVFFYLKEHFGFGDGGNLMVSALYGLLYMITAWAVGPFAFKHGYFKTLRLGFTGMAAMMILGGVMPHVLGYSHSMLLVEWGIVAFWTVSTCSTWPTLQSLLSQKQSPAELSRTAGFYNMVWAAANSVAYFTSGLLLDKFGGEILFWFSAGLNILQLCLLPRLEKMEAQLSVAEIPPASTDESLPQLNPRPIAKARTFLHLAWISNPFAYVAIYGIMPMIPVLAANLGLSATSAGLVGSVWQWVRLVAFVWFFCWPGWHYKFRWLLAAFLAMIGSFVGMMLAPNVATLVGAQVAFGMATGLIYYSSLFYSMDAGESKGKKGGFHEAAIGLGIFIGPGTGVASLHFFPQYANAAIWGMSALLLVGLALFLWIRVAGRK